MKRTLAALLLTLLADGAAQAQLRAGAGPTKADKRIVLRTTMGDIVLALYPDVAPKHVEQITKLVELGAYDTTAFVRIEPNFVVQLSDVDDRLTPLTDEQREAIHTLPAEFSPTLKHRQGTVSMARPDGEPNGARTSFSILMNDAPHLDNQYTIFGELEHGGEVIDAMRRVKTELGNRPRTRITVEKALAVPDAEVSSLGLRGAILQSDVPEVPQAANPASTLALVLVMMFLGLCTFIASGRFSPKVVGSIGLLVVFVGFFVLMVALMAQPKPTWLGGLLFAGTIGLFKLLNRFESPRPDGSKRI